VLFNLSNSTSTSASQKEHIDAALIPNSSIAASCNYQLRTYRYNDFNKYKQATLQRYNLDMSLVAFNRNIRRILSIEIKNRLIASPYRFLGDGRVATSQHIWGRRRNINNTTGQKPTDVAKNDAEIVETTGIQYAALKDANAQMQKYHETRELMRQGKLKNLNSNNQMNHTATAVQASILVVFLLAFIASPFIGKKIARDDEFRKKYIPSWYDFTVKKPENAWTRDELHEQMLQVQHDIHTRAIAGEFTPEKLQQLQNALQSPMGSSQDMDNVYHPHRQGMDRSRIPKEWDMIHPGMDVDEELDERDN
jgi:hypothetical protein